jgi:hypothetical protein
MLQRQARDFRVYKVIALNHHYAKEGKLYLEGGRRVLHVFPDLPECAATIALRLELTKRAGRDAEYDDVIVHTIGETDADRA